MPEKASSGFSMPFPVASQLRHRYANAMPTPIRRQLEDAVGDDLTWHMSLGAAGVRPLQEDAHSCGVWALSVEVAFVEFQGASGNSENVSLSLSFSEFWAEKMAKIEDRQVFIAEQRQAFAADVAAKQEQTRLADLTPRLWPAVAKYAATGTSARRVAVTLQRPTRSCAQAR